MPDQVTLRYVRDAVGYPRPGTVVEVERTDHTDRLVELGIAVIEDGHTDATVPPGAGDTLPPADPPEHADEDTAPDGSTKTPAKKTPTKKAAAKKASRRADD